MIVMSECYDHQVFIYNVGQQDATWREWWNTDHEVFKNSSSQGFPWRPSEAAKDRQIWWSARISWGLCFTKCPSYTKCLYGQGMTLSLWWKIFLDIMCFQVHDFATDAAIMTEKFEEAFAHGILALKTYQLVHESKMVGSPEWVHGSIQCIINFRDYLPEIHPLTGIQMMKLGKILLFTCRNVEAIRMLLEVLTTMSYAWWDFSNSLHNIINWELLSVMLMAFAIKLHSTSQRLRSFHPFAMFFPPQSFTSAKQLFMPSEADSSDSWLVEPCSRSVTHWRIAFHNHTWTWKVKLFPGAENSPNHSQS